MVRIVLRFTFESQEIIVAAAVGSRKRTAGFGSCLIDPAVAILSVEESANPPVNLVGLSGAESVCGRDPTW